MGEKGLKVSRSWGQNDLMGKYLFAFYNERDIAELFLVQERYQILLILSLSSHPVIIEIIFKNNRLLRDWSQTSWQSWYLVVGDVLQDILIHILWNLLDILRRAILV